MNPKRLLLLLLVFMAGMTSMAIEMAGSRLLAPYFGNSLLVWANLIGLILLYLTVGYYLGGWLADRFPRAENLFRLTSMAALTTALIPSAARPLLRLAAAGFASFQWGLLASSFLAVAALFAAPMILLGAVSPFAIRLDLHGLHSTGRVAGRIYGLSTLGSILGTFLPVFWLIPTFGTRQTFLFFAAILGAMSAVGSWQILHRKAWPQALLLLLILVLWLWGPPSATIKPTAGLLYEGESAYNYIQVLKEGDAYILKLNEGEGNQSIYVPGQVLLQRIFDYFLVAPLFCPADQPVQVGRICLIGLAGGTIARQYSAIYGPVPIDGLEIDPEIIAVGRKYFAMDLSNLNAIAQDGRYFLQQQGHDYDVIIVDAYTPPYIPFHLTTAEFFAEARDRLTSEGVIAINVARPETDEALVEAIASTVKAVFPAVFIVDAPESYNSMVVATRRQVSLDDFAAQAARVGNPLLRDVAQRASQHLREFSSPTTPPLRDDRAPVEQVIHQMIWRFIRSS